MIGKLGRVAIGAGAACGIVCALPLLLAALGIGGATALAAAAHEIDELLFCSPLGVRLIIGAAVLILVVCAYRGMHRALARRSRRRGEAGSCSCP